MYTMSDIIIYIIHFQLYVCASVVEDKWKYKTFIYYNIKNSNWKQWNCVLTDEMFPNEKPL